MTLGVRLLSSRFPGGYEAILYGRGTWLFHMLRSMLKDAAVQAGGSKVQGGASTEEPFVRALRKVRQNYEGKSISTAQLIDAFAEELPPTLRYENKKSLDWFLEGWVNGTSLPKLELKAVKFTPKGTGSVVSGTILQKDAPQDLVTSVPVYAVMAGKQTVLLGRVFADGEESTFRLAAPAGAHKIVLDPNETILTESAVGGPPFVDPAILPCRIGISFRSFQIEFHSCDSRNGHVGNSIVAALGRRGHFPDLSAAFSFGKSC